MMRTGFKFFSITLLFLLCSFNTLLAQSEDQKVIKQIERAVSQLKSKDQKKRKKARRKLTQLGRDHPAGFVEILKQKRQQTGSRTLKKELKTVIRALTEFRRDKTASETIRSLPDLSTSGPLTISPDGETVVSTTKKKHVVRVYNLDRGTLRKTLKQPAPIRSISFSGDGDRFAVLSGKNRVSLYKTESLKLIRKETYDLDKNQQINRVHISPNGKQLIFVGVTKIAFSKPKKGIIMKGTPDKKAGNQIRAYLISRKQNTIGVTFLHSWKHILIYGVSRVDSAHRERMFLLDTANLYMLEARDFPADPRARARFLGFTKQGHLISVGDGKIKIWDGLPDKNKQPSIKNMQIESSCPSPPRFRSERISLFQQPNKLLLLIQNDRGKVTVWSRFYNPDKK